MVLVTGYILLFALCRCYFRFQSKHVVLIYSWNVSLVRGWWESAQIQFNLWSVYYMFWWDLVLTSPWRTLHAVPRRMPIVTIISISTHSVKVTSATKVFFCHEVALDVEFMNFFIWRKNNPSLWRYLDFRVFVESKNFKICVVTLLLISVESKVPSNWNLVKY